MFTGLAFFSGCASLGNEKPQEQIIYEKKLPESHEIKKLVVYHTKDCPRWVAKFCEFIELVEKDYIKPISRTKLIDHAINGVMDELGPYAMYISASAIRLKKHDLKASPENRGYLGLHIEKRNGHAIVLGTYPDSPAEEAGIMRGDVIMDSGIPDGLLGTRVELTIQRPCRPEPFRVVLVRSKVDFSKLASRILSYRIGYVRVERISGNVSGEVRDAIARFQKSGPLRGFILDLRDDPGGNLYQTDKLIRTFLNGDRDILVRNARAVSVITGKNLKDHLHGAPLVILVNNNTASAAEAVTLALQDYRRATVFGKRTYGKGTIQRNHVLSDGSLVYFTIGRYATHLGRGVDKRGVTPHVHVDEYDGQCGDRQLEKAIDYIKNVSRRYAVNSRPGYKE